MSRQKPVVLLGRQPIPAFARRATLHQTCVPSVVGLDEFPALKSPFNIAALVFYGRRAGRVGAGLTTSITYWTDQPTNGLKRFGADSVNVPNMSEYFGVAWLQPPTVDYLSVFPPEEFFNVVWELHT